MEKMYYSRKYYIFDNNKKVYEATVIVEDEPIRKKIREYGYHGMLGLYFDACEEKLRNYLKENEISYIGFMGDTASGNVYLDDSTNHVRIEPLSEKRNAYYLENYSIDDLRK